MIKSASFSIYLGHITSLYIFRDFTKGTERWMTFSKKEGQGTEFKVAKEVAQRRMELPRIKHGCPMLGGIAVPHKASTTSRPAMWHSLAVPCGTIVPPGQCWLVGPCHVARPCPPSTCAT